VEPSGSASPAAPRRITNRQRVRECHEAHPDWTAEQIAADTGLGAQQVRVIASQTSLKLPKPFTPEVVPPANPQKPVAPPPRTGTLTDRVRAVHHQHPTWTARMIANELGANYTSVSTTLGKVRGEKPAPAQKHQFEGRADMISHYSEVAKRLGKPA